MEEFELELGETITKVVQQHPFLLALRLIPYIVLAVLPLIALPILELVTKTSLGGGIVRFVIGAYWLVLWMSAFTLLTKYFLTMWVITSQRIVDITQNGFFSRDVSSFLLARVQDITTDVEGLFPTMIGYGTLNVETAGRMEKFQMEGIAHPEAIRDLIMREIADLQSHDNLGTKIAKTVGDALI